MKQQVLNTIKKYDMLSSGDKVVLGLSGGADSVCLALILNELKSELSLDLSAVHVNHNIRGEESNRDMEFCIDFCNNLKIPLKIFNIDVVSYAKEQNLGIEECARNIRYECFGKQAGGGKIATAHNLDDVAETMIFNITRGASINGICSIPAKRDNIIRPLISVSREQIEAFLQSVGQKYVTDSTNLKDEYTRNKIRHNVIPILKEINPGFLNSVNRLKNIAETQTDYFLNKVSKLINDGIGISELRKLHDSVIFEYIAEFVKRESGLILDFFHIEKCVEVIKYGGKCQLPKDYFFITDDEKITVKKQDILKDSEFAVEFNSYAKTPYNIYRAEFVSQAEFKNKKNVYNLFLNDAINYDKICHSLIIRNRRPGDKIRLKNRRVNKQIKALYNELKIPVDVRNKLAVLECDGKIVWAEFIGVSDEFIPNKNTEKILLIKREVDYH